MTLKTAFQSFNAVAKHFQNCPQSQKPVMVRRLRGCFSSLRHIPVHGNCIQQFSLILECAETRLIVSCFFVLVTSFH
ncbi:hypothetical protein L596_026361 [Steinernema carpocapsae]|uniref:Uncharacterized protein n=1 Tax=Steinernema carpocapsae TaxID=34508 RepID=A0A4U5M162_STECR|nr:hypothetical protein L596_026361 [Steinernema carpocapsae]